MCNPRRIRVRATRKIAEAWRAEIQQAATARSDVSSEARLVQSISDLLPPQAKLAFEQAMRIAPDWEWIGTEYRKAVPGGYVSYRPDTGELEIVIQLSVAIEAVGTATLVATGEVADEVTTEASGTYYTDGWRGKTKDRIQQEVTANADAKADELARNRAAALKQEAEEAARFALVERKDEAAAEARRSAEHQLTLRATDLRPDLDQQAGQRLEAVQAETLQGIFQLVASGYSIALQAYAAEHGQNLQVYEDDDVIEIQFEVEQ
jgi:FtsH ternary system domain X2